MNRKEWKILIVIILIFASIGGIYLGRNYHKKKNEEECIDAKEDVSKQPYANVQTGSSINKPLTFTLL